MSPPHDSITDVPGIKVGHWSNRRAATGCTVVLCEGGAVCGVDVRGGGPGTRETDLLRPEFHVPQVYAVLLCGGSAFGLDAAAGVMRYLEERGIGYPTSARPVPIVPAAVLYDLSLGRSDVRPNAAAGYRACLAASGDPVAQGSVGAGTGATVAKAMGIERALKGGIGSASEGAVSGVVVGALVAVNAIGDIVDPDTGQVIAAPRAEPGTFHDTLVLLRQRLSPQAAPSTTIAVVATNASLDKAQATRLAIMASAGIARAVRPAFGTADGDVVFALATGVLPLGPQQLTAVGALAARAVERAIVRAVRRARGLAGVPAAQEWLSAAK